MAEHAARLLALGVLLALVACGGDEPAAGSAAGGAPTGGARTGGAPDGPATPDAAAAPDDLDPPPAAPADFEPWLVDEAAARGLRFEHVSGHAAGRYLMPEIMGGGGALADLDDDGLLDAYLVQSGRLEGGATAPGNALFLNGAGGEAGRFRDASAGSGADDRGYGMGAACGDADGDGDLDLYVTNTGANVLLRNEGDGRFTDVTASAGVGDAGFGASAGFADLDADGQLDLFVTNYLVWSPAAELSCHNDMGGNDYCDPANYAAPARDVVYRNRGGGRFEDVTDACGVGDLPGTGLGLSCGDFDGDGLVDVFVANDGMPDRLWSNRTGADGVLRFEDVALAAGCALDTSGKAKAGMGVATADVDDDGDLDLLVCNLDRQTDSFFLNDGHGHFLDRTNRAGLAVASRRFTRFGVAWVDLDHDGRLDLYQANGRVRRQWRRWAEDPYGEPDLLQVGRDGGRFDTLPGLDGTAAPAALTGRGAALGDVDGDGAVDVLVVNRDGPARLLVNHEGRRRAAAGDGRWVAFDVRLPSGAPALGAVVRFSAGERRVRGDVRTVGSYLSSHDPTVHAGLGVLEGVTDVRVTWPDGAEERFGDRAAGAVHRLVQGAGEG